MNSRNIGNKILTTLLMLLFALLATAVPWGAGEEKKEKEHPASKTNAPPPKHVPPPKEVHTVTPNVQHTNPPPRVHEGPVTNYPAGKPSGGGTNPPTAMHGGAGTYNPAVRPSGGGTNPPTAMHGGAGTYNPAVRPSGGGTNPPTAVHKGAGTYNPAFRPPGGGGTNPPTTFHGGPGANRPAFTPPANVKASPGPAGTTYTHPDGRRWVVDRNNHVRAFSRPGMQASFRPDGRVNNIRVTRPDRSVMTVHRGLYGGRETIVTRPGGVRVVSYGGNRGFVERPLPQRGYVARTYVVGGQPRVYVYRTYYYRNAVYYRYVPAFYYRPVFYGWVFRPWPAPVIFSWGWGPAPWYGFYGGYFAPAPVYPTAALWLTDFLLAENLRLAYEARKEKEREYAEQQREAATPEVQTSSTEVTLSPEVKAAIAEEVQRQVAAEQAAAEQPAQPVQPVQPPEPGQPPAPSQPPEPVTQPPAAGNVVPPPALDPNHRMFVVSENLDAMEKGQPCALTPGDVIYRTGDTVIDGNKVAVNVLTSKAGDCPANTATEVDVNVLQEMQNQFQQQIDAGLKTLAEDQGKKGLPPGPSPGAVAVPEGTAPPDANAGSELREQQQAADQAEGEAQGGSGGS